jgi:hypothetical protein
MRGFCGANPKSTEFKIGISPVSFNALLDRPLRVLPTEGRETYLMVMKQL